MLPIDGTPALRYDDHRPACSGSCSELSFTIARLLVPEVGDEVLLSTAAAVSLEGDRPFFVSTAHSLYRDGVLRAPPERISVELNVPDPTGACRFPPARIALFAIGAARPRKRFFGAARDFMLFDMEADAPLPGPIVSTPRTSGGRCGSGAVELVGFASDFQFGRTACRDRCRLRDRPDESAYPDSSLQHHACDASAGSSGALLLCETARGTGLPIAVHAVGWRTSGRPIGSGIDNVATPLSAQMLRLLHRELRKGDD